MRGSNSRRSLLELSIVANEDGQVAEAGEEVVEGVS